ncbi:7101_t:CDS:1, partial [Gigaspora margarita]
PAYSRPYSHNLGVKSSNEKSHLVITIKLNHQESQTYCSCGA